MKKTIFTLSLIVSAYILNAQVLYGTTLSGGNNNSGAICKLVTATNTLTAQFSFDGVDGTGSQYSKLIQASDGKLYGMTYGGGRNDYGVIFSYDPATSSYTKLVDLDGINGAYPSGSLIQASDGKLYGTTFQGGDNNNGVIFSYNPATSVYTKLKDFDVDGTDGAYPSGGLVQASDGKLYGMTYEGGNPNVGVIFSYDPAALTYTKLKDFDGADGAYPFGSLMQASDGKLYGMTYQGGDNDEGVIFSYDPATSAYTKLIDFFAVPGASPIGSLTQASDGKLYGMTAGGGHNFVGVIFSYDPATSIYAKLVDFDYTNGSNPDGSLIQASDGNLYGMTSKGGDNNNGVIFSYDPVTLIFTKLVDFDYTNGAYPDGSLVQASDGKLYGMAGGGTVQLYGVIFSYNPSASTYTKLRDFGGNNTGNSIGGALIKVSENKLYGMTSQGGSYGAGTIFSYDAKAAVFTKLKDFDGINGSYPIGSLVQASDGKLYGMTSEGGNHNAGVILSYDPAALTYTKLKDFDGADGTTPDGSLVQASDGKLYGMTSSGGSYNVGVIFSYNPVTSTFTKLVDFNFTNGASPHGSLVQASDGKLYGMTLDGGSNYVGNIFSYDPATSIYAKLKDFDYKDGTHPYGSLMQASDGKLYGMTLDGGSNIVGVIFSYDPSTSIYTKLKDFDNTSGAYPSGSLMQASGGKLYGMTSRGGSNGFGVAFSYDPATSTFTKLSDFNGDNGSSPFYTSFTEITTGIQISIQDKSVIEGDKDMKFIFVPITLSESLKKIIRVNYTTQNNTATAGSDYAAQSGTLVFPPGLKKIFLPIRIKGDQVPEATETFSIILSHPLNATIVDDTGIITILDDDASALNASKAMTESILAINLSPNPAQDKVKIVLTGFTGNVVIQLSSFDGRILQQQKLKALSSKPAQQQLNVSSYTNGTYLVTAIDEKGNRQTGKLVIDR